MCVRIVRGERGSVAMRIELVLRFDYGAIVPWVTQARPTARCARSPAPTWWCCARRCALRGEDMTTVGEFTSATGDSVPFVLTLRAVASRRRRRLSPIRSGARNEPRHSGLSGRARRAQRGPGPTRSCRSLITLKALTYAPTGGIVAAPTTSLPEQIGGIRNWDYRYCWVRDATLTLLALMNAGYFEEARAWRDWLLRAAAGAPAQMQMLYGVAGERRLIEWEVPWLPGYEGSPPVRIGNARARQLQLDVYGEVMDALYQARRGGLAARANPAGQCNARCWSIWRRSGAGRMRASGKCAAAPQHFTYSKVMAWVAFDRAIRTAEKFGLPGRVERWRGVRDEIHEEVMRARLRSRRAAASCSSYGSTANSMPACCCSPPVGFLPARRSAHRAAPSRRSSASCVVDGLVLRYNTRARDDGLPPGEGAFLACSFWLADAYLLLGRRR